MVQHIKRIASPRSWPIMRKEYTWVTSPKSGHALDTSVSLNVVFKDLLKLTKTTKETRYIIFNKDVKLNGNKVRSEKTGMGIFDVLTFGDTKENHTLLLNTRGRLVAKQISDKEAANRISKVTGKTYLPGKRIQLNMAGGINAVVQKDEYAVGDTVLFSLKEKKVTQNVKLEKGCLVYLLTGKNISKIAKVEDVKDRLLTCVCEDVEFKIGKDDVIVVGKDKPIITIE
ncbi:MAG: hypothetical protein ACLFTR_01820 [Candidatus Woesearchaeota archaeon]